MRLVLPRAPLHGPAAFPWMAVDRPWRYPPPSCCVIDATILVITSPARSHPSTEVIWTVLDTLPLLGGLSDAPIVVVCDGCRASSSLEPIHAQRVRAKLERDPCALSKRGIVSDDVARNYESFQKRFAQEAASKLLRRVSMLKLDSHHGFALAVREGLLATRTRFALVVQHDRAFIRRVSAADVGAIAAHFDAQLCCRYVGFPSGTSKRLAARVANQYKLSALLERRSYTLRGGSETSAETSAEISADTQTAAKMGTETASMVFSAGNGDARTSLLLRPSVFWYDSNHLVDCTRALEIYEPFRHATAEMHARLGPAGVGRFRIRRGDFIEERFGVEQRNFLASLSDAPTEELLSAFDWFGTYLIEEIAQLGTRGVKRGLGGSPGERDTESDGGDTEGDDTTCGDALPLFADREGRVTHISHIDARSSLTPSQRRQGAVRTARRLERE
jgi:hypothetical protein